jgi:hypothetical protein
VKKRGNCPQYVVLRTKIGEREGELSSIGGLEDKYRRKRWWTVLNRWS